MQANDKLAAARLLAVTKMPYFKAAILGMVPVKVHGLGTIGVTRKGVMVWDPKALDAWTTEQTAGVLIHEAMHLLRLHADRFDKIKGDAQLWNIAADCEINDDLQAARLPLPNDGCFPNKLGLDEGLTAEEYYRLLEQHVQKQIMKKKGEDQEKDIENDNEDGEGASSGKQGQEKDESGPQGNRVAEALGIKPGVGSGQCGGCAGNPNEGEEQHDGRTGRNKLELERMRKQVAEEVRKEAEKGRGTIPGGLRRWAEEYLKPPTIPWRQKLARAVRGAIAYRPGAVDLHYTAPSRRQAGIGFGPGKPILPALRAPIPRVSVIVDTSGSMGAGELNTAISETRGVLDACGANVQFCACDAAVHTLQKVRTWKEAVSLLKGGGGTDFRPAFEAVVKDHPKPDVVIFITDGMGPAPEEPPPCKVIWVLVGPYRSTPATWGEIIEIDDARRAA
jgi:predicted metal-dependent peptidase